MSNIYEVDRLFYKLLTEFTDYSMILHINYLGQVQLRNVFTICNINSSHLF